MTPPLPGTPAFGRQNSAPVIKMRVDPARAPVKRRHSTGGMSQVQNEFDFRYGVTRASDDGVSVHLTIDVIISGIRSVKDHLIDNGSAEDSDDVKATQRAVEAIDDHLKLATDFVRKDANGTAWVVLDSDHGGGPRPGGREVPPITWALLGPFRRLASLNAHKDYEERRVKDSALFQTAEVAFRELSLLVLHPKVMQALVEEATFDWHGQPPNDLVFTFALRNIVTRLAFETMVNRMLYHAFRMRVMETEHVIEKNKEFDVRYSWRQDAAVAPWSRAFALVGFNRLMSPNNALGASISSDIDFKLVIDVSELRASEGQAAPTELSYESRVRLTKQLNAGLKALQPRFEEMRLTLEVADFTTKELIILGRELTQYDAERNFLASILHNSVFISGSFSVFEEFKRTLRKYDEEHQEFIVAARSWTQFLGETDKGSIQVITQLDELKNVATVCADVISSNHMKHDEMQQAFAKKTGVKWSDVKTADKKRWIASPHVFKTLLGVSWGEGAQQRRCYEVLAANSSVQAVLSQLQIFTALDAGEQIKRAAKLLAGVTDEHAYAPDASEPCLQQIGSPMAKLASWRYSLKYAGCRPNDFFDAVPKHTYLAQWWAWEEESVSKAVYAAAKSVAEAINGVALGLQTAIYRVEHSRTVDTPTHADIDALYSRLTKEQYDEMRDSEAVDLAALFGKLSASLDAARPAVVTLANDPSQPGDLQQRAKDVVEGIDAVLEQISGQTQPTAARSNGFLFFDALFKLAIDLAAWLKAPEA